jgi:hypothetical protein
MDKAPARHSTTLQEHRRSAMSFLNLNGVSQTDMPNKELKFHTLDNNKIKEAIRRKL